MTREKRERQRQKIALRSAETQWTNTLSRKGAQKDGTPRIRGQIMGCLSLACKGTCVERALEACIRSYIADIYVCTTFARPIRICTEIYKLGSKLLVCLLSHALRKQSVQAFFAGLLGHPYKSISRNEWSQEKNGVSHGQTWTRRGSLSNLAPLAWREITL